MKKLKTLSLTLLILTLMITTVFAFAAYGQVLTISSGNSTYSPTTNKNAITHIAISKEQLADANKIENLETTSISTINGKVEGRMGSLTGDTTYDKVQHTYYRTPTTNNYATAEGYSKAEYKDGTISYDTDRKTFRILGFTALSNDKLTENNKTDLEIIFDERENLKNKEIKFLKENNKSMLRTRSMTNKNIDLEKLTHINDVYVEEYPEYMEIYYEHIINHINEGDYMPSGVYVDNDNKKLYIVAISENKIYEYDIKTNSK